MARAKKVLPELQLPDVIDFRKNPAQAEQQLQQAVKQTQAQQIRRNKYGNQAQVIDGFRFDSKLEARFYELVARPGFQQGIFRDLKIHPKFLLKLNGILIATYETDFSFIDVRGILDEPGKLLIVDTKGVLTDVYKLKKRFYEAQYKQPITEVKSVTEKAGLLTITYNRLNKSSVVTLK